MSCRRVMWVVCGSGHGSTVTPSVEHGELSPTATSDVACRASMRASSHCISSSDRRHKDRIRLTNSAKYLHNSLSLSLSLSTSLYHSHCSRVTRWITLITLYTKLDDQCDKLEILLTTLDGLQWRNFAKSRVWDKVLQELSIYFGVT